MSSLIPEMRDLDPAGLRLPVKLDSTTNGEFTPVPLDDSLHHANYLARQWAGELARKHFAPLYGRAVGQLALDIEFKLTTDHRIIFKQARPYTPSTR